MNVKGDEQSESVSEKLDIVPVMPGAASLGAYQAGAMAAILAGRHALAGNGVDIAIPAVGGASAGATVALVAAHSLAQALDPVALLRSAWVDYVDLDMLATGADAPLGHERLRSALADLLASDADEFRPAQSVQPQDVSLLIALTSLRGHRYQLEALGRRPVDAVTYADWTTVRYCAGDDPARLVTADGASALDAVMASTANPVVFAPQPLDCTGAVETDDRQATQASAPDEDTWWFSDGGLVQSRPVHRTLGLVSNGDRTTRCVIIDPRSEGPSTGNTWVGSGGDTGWLSGLVRALSIFPAQVLSDELRRIDHENQIRRAMAALAPLLDVSDPDGFDAWCEQRELPEMSKEVHAALIVAAGLDSAQSVAADVIHPRLVADRSDVRRLLAGDILGDFGGFVSRELRMSDFALGFACGRRWWGGVLEDVGLQRYGSELDDHLDAVGPPQWRAADESATTISDLPMAAKLRLVWVVVRALRAALWR